MDHRRDIAGGRRLAPEDTPDRRYTWRVAQVSKYLSLVCPVGWPGLAYFFPVQEVHQVEDTTVVIYRKVKQRGCPTRRVYAWGFGRARRRAYPPSDSTLAALNDFELWFCFSPPCLQLN